MASLPSNTFICNYNARDYVAGTHTLPKTTGQVFNLDIVLTGNTSAVIDNSASGYITFSSSGTACEFNLSTTAANPFNRTDTNTGRNLTIIYKTSNSFGGTGNDLIANRDPSNYNYMVRQGVFHTSISNFLPFSASTSPSIMFIRVDTNGYSERKCVTTEQIVTSSTIDYGNAASGLAFFKSRLGGTGEYFVGDFYWIYISTETLTDAEIKQVIAYNEDTSIFETDITAITTTYNSTTSSVTLTAEEDMAWTASTSNDWITLSTTGGTGSSVFTVTLAKNKAYAARNGLVTLTNGEDTIEITVEQAKHPLLIPNENIYRADLEVIKGYRSGSTINKAYRSGELIYYKLNYPQPTPPGPEETPLTFNILSAGTIVWKTFDSALTRTIEYKKNEGNWTSITSSTDGVSIPVDEGDVLQFRGNNATYSGFRSFNTFSGSTAKFEIEGNIMSLIDSTNFATATTLVSSYTFSSLFYNCTGLTSAENLVLPATTLTERCYDGMFSYCTSLTTAPELPAATLADWCYRGMFDSCSSLNYIKCLATDISANNCTYYWVYDVSSTGTFVTPSSTSWSTGNSGIPSGWTRVDA